VVKKSQKKSSYSLEKIEKLLNKAEIFIGLKVGIDITVKTGSEPLKAKSAAFLADEARAVRRCLAFRKVDRGK
jgi:hypothetical protein